MKVYVTSQQCPPAYSKPSNMILQSQVCELKEWCKHFGFRLEIQGGFIFRNIQDLEPEYDKIFWNHWVELLA